MKKNKQNHDYSGVPCSRVLKKTHNVINKISTHWFRMELLRLLQELLFREWGYNNSFFYSFGLL